MCLKLEIPASVCAPPIILLFAMPTTATPTAESKFSETLSPTTKVLSLTVISHRNVIRRSQKIQYRFRLEVPEFPVSHTLPAKGYHESAWAKMYPLANFRPYRWVLAGEKVRRYRNHSEVVSKCCAVILSMPMVYYYRPNPDSFINT